MASINSMQVTENADGTALLWADGTMLCFHTSPTVEVSTTAFGSFFQSLGTTFTYPVMFGSSTLLPVVTHGFFNRGIVPVAAFHHINETRSGFDARIFSFISGAGGNISYQALGRKDV